MSTITAGRATRHTVIDSPLGALTVVGDDEGLTGLYFPGHWTRPDTSTFGPRVDLDDPRLDGSVLHEAADQLGEYFSGRRREFDLPLRPSGGSGDAGRVWDLLAEIPYGRTTTYGDIARRIGGGATPRDVGQDVARNPLSIIIPCHRVLGATGKLTGYAGGPARKQRLLELEGAIPGRTDTLW